MKIKLPEQRAYDLLCRYGTLSARDLSKKLDIDRSTAFDLIERLRRKGDVIHSTEGAKWHPTVPF